MDLGIRGKKAIVAGGSAGMGKGSALALAEEGVEVFLSARGEERLVAAAREITERTGSKVTPVISDHSTEAGRELLIAACPEPDIMVVTISPPKPVFDYNEISVDDWHASVDAGLIGPVELMRHFTAGMAERGWGRVVNIGTIAAKYPLDMRLLSGPARSALTNYAAVVSRQVAQHGVIINSVLPGMIATEGLFDILRAGAKAEGLDLDQQDLTEGLLKMFDIPTHCLGEADDVGQIVAMLCSQAASFIVGQSIVVDGGMARGLF